MIYTKEVENMCPVAKGAKHEPAPIPEEGKWVHSKKIEDISGFTHGVGWCAPQQGEHKPDNSRTAPGPRIDTYTADDNGGICRREIGPEDTIVKAFY